MGGGYLKSSRCSWSYDSLRTIGGLSGLVIGGRLEVVVADMWHGRVPAARNLRGRPNCATRDTFARDTTGVLD